MIHLLIGLIDLTDKLGFTGQFRELGGGGGGGGVGGVKDRVRVWKQQVKGCQRERVGRGVFGVGWGGGSGG